jgi:uridine kinase
VDPADVVIVEGILVLHVPELRDILNMKIYVDTGSLLATSVYIETVESMSFR